MQPDPTGTLRFAPPANANGEATALRAAVPPDPAQWAWLCASGEWRIDTGLSDPAAESRLRLPGCDRGAMDGSRRPSLAVARHEAAQITPESWNCLAGARLPIFPQGSEQGMGRMSMSTTSQRFQSENMEKAAESRGVTNHLVTPCNSRGLKPALKISGRWNKRPRLAAPIALASSAGELIAAWPVTRPFGWRRRHPGTRLAS
jgi:hypothetical protein